MEARERMADLYLKSASDYICNIWRNSNQRNNRGLVLNLFFSCIICIILLQCKRAFYPKREVLDTTTKNRGILYRSEILDGISLDSSVIIIFTLVS